MVFSSPIFIFLFLPITLTIYLLSRLVWKRASNFILLCASLLFYAWGEPKYVLIMIFSIVMNYIFGLLIDFLSDKKSKKIALSGAIALNLLLLIAFKYANFIVDNLNYVLSLINAPTLNIEQVHLPIGISFFTFQAMSYVIDVYRKETPVQKSLVNIALYISLFPQLIAGPIVRYHDIAKQIYKRIVSLPGFSLGVERFIIGLGKKVLIANVMASVTDQIFVLPNEQLTFSLSWLGIISYALQIYFDFSGYSDMAIGLGHMFGFSFLENFNYPYISKSIKEFWRRWHISLSTWFRDYLYIPLGGNRKGKTRTYFNLMATMVLGGLWHGASWRFVLWGTVHGLALAIEKLLGYPKWINEKGWGVKIFGVILTFHIWAFSMIFFRAQSYKIAFDMIHQITHFFHAEVFPQFVSGYPMVVAIFIVGMLSHFTPVKLEERIKAFLSSSPVVVQSLILAIVIIIVVQFKTSDIQPFIYFQF